MFVYFDIFWIMAVFLLINVYFVSERFHSEGTFFLISTLYLALFNVILTNLTYLVFQII